MLTRGPPLRAVAAVGMRACSASPSNRSEPGYLGHPYGMAQVVAVNAMRIRTIGALPQLSDY